MRPESSEPPISLSLERCDRIRRLLDADPTLDRVARALASTLRTITPDEKREYRTLDQGTKPVPAPRSRPGPTCSMCEKPLSEHSITDRTCLRMAEAGLTRTRRGDPA